MSYSKADLIALLTAQANSANREADSLEREHARRAEIARVNRLELPASDSDLARAHEKRVWAEMYVQIIEIVTAAPEPRS